MHKSRKNGFTMIELLAVITIMAILMAVAIPSFRGITKNARMNSSLSKLKSVLSLARQEAATSQRPVYVVFPDSAQDTDKGYRAYAVFSGENDESKREQLSDWYYLSEGICFDPTEKRGSQTNMANIFTFRTSLADEEFPPDLPLDQYAYVKFNSGGAMSASGSTTYPRVHLIEAIQVAGKLIPQNLELIESGTFANNIKINNLTGICRVQKSVATSE